MPSGISEALKAGIPLADTRGSISPLTSGMLLNMPASFHVCDASAPCYPLGGRYSSVQLSDSAGVELANFDSMKLLRFYAGSIGYPH